MSAEDMGDYKEFPTKESALDWLDNYLSIDERNNLIRALQQEPILDEIRAEIIGTLYVDSLIFGELIDFRNGKISADDVIEEFNRVSRAEVINIIDKYKTEIESQESSALDFNEPMQVELEGDGYADGELVYDYGKCPKCGWEFEDGDKDWEEPYCCHCGQRLEWFESEE